MGKNKYKKTLYWDTRTDVKMNKAVRKTNESASKIIRAWVASPKFDEFIKELK